VKIFLAVLAALVALIVWLAVLHVKVVAPPPDMKPCAGELASAVSAVFAPLDSNTAVPLEQVRAAQEQARRNSSVESRKETAELCLSLSRQILAAHGERERVKARLKQLAAATAPALKSPSPAAPQLKGGTKGREIGETHPVQPATSPAATASAAARQQWTQYVSSARPQCEALLRRLTDGERSAQPEK
jgi:hypothetical protein